MTAEHLVIKDSTITLAKALKEFTNIAFDGSEALDKLIQINVQDAVDIGRKDNHWPRLFIFLLQASESTQLSRKKALKEFPEIIYGECSDLLYIFNSGADWVSIGLSKHLKKEFRRISRELGIKPKEVKLEQFLQLVLNGDFILIPEHQEEL